MNAAARSGPTTVIANTQHTHTMATEGDKLFQQATKKAQSSGGWFSSASSKHEAAADLFQQSANAYKAELNFSAAGQAFSSEAEQRIKQGDAQHEVVQAWVNAGRCFKKTDPPKAVEVLGRAVTGLVKQGQFRQAADREKEVSPGGQEDSAISMDEVWVGREDHGWDASHQR